MNKNSHEVIPLINRFIQHLIKEDKSDNTIKTYKMVLINFHEWLLLQNKSLKNLTKNDVQNYIHHLESENKSPFTVEKIFVTINVFSRFLKKPLITDRIQRLESKKAPYISKEKSLDAYELECLQKEVNLKGNLRDITIVYTLLHTGIKLSELCALNQSDIQLSENKGFVTIRDSKNKIKRVIPLSQELQHYLKSYMNSLPSDQEALFISSLNKRISGRSIQYMLKRYNVTPHKLRHTFCKQLIQKGVNVATVAKLAGHSDLNVTKRYSHNSEAPLEKVINSAFF